MKKNGKKFNFHQKLVARFSIILLLATLIVGGTSYFIARTALNEKGKQILENCVNQSLEIVEAQYQIYASGAVTEAEAQEQAKILIMGTLNEDGTRNRENQVNLGENGYCLIYDSQGNEVMHPYMEGKNVWELTDAKDSNKYIAQNQIAIAKNNGGFMTYNLTYLDSDKIEKKISYALYFEKWDWIVVATSYMVDYNSAANQILFYTLILILILVVVIIYTMDKYINSITNPITSILSGMEELKKGIYYTVENKEAEDDLKNLILGYNNMVGYLEEREHKINSQNEEMTYLAFHDEMTKLPNFYGMEDYTNHQIASGVNNASLVLVHIKGLHIINALMGFDKGNHLLKHVGEFFKRKKKDFFSARISGNEFCLWIEQDNIEALTTLLVQLKKELKTAIHDCGYGATADFCIAVSNYPEHGLDFQSLYEKATLAMKVLKDSATTTSVTYENEMRAQVEEKLNLYSELAKAFQNNEIVPYYQEKVDYKTGMVVGVETLARWHSPSRGMLSPGFFLPLIFDYNLTDDFTNYMIRTSLADYARLTEKYGNQIELSVNITPSSFLNTNIFDFISNAIKEYSIPKGKLILEITEDVFVSDIITIQEISRDLHKIGVRISIDDFGTGYSSLNSLAQIEFDELKIDKSFIDKILYDEKAFKLVNIICDIAALYDYKIVAEGVETNEQLEQLKSTRLTIIQGYLFSKPFRLE